MDIVDLPAVEQAGLLARRELSSRELVDACRARADAVEPVVNALAVADWGRAAEQAAAIDAAATRDVGEGLRGLVTGFKDLLETVDFPTSLGSAVFVDHRPEEDHPVVTRLRDAAPVVIGKTNTPEFGAGSHTFNQVHGLTRNPWDPTRSAGGSSGGAAAAVATGVLSVADGSDLGGSLRNPPAFCGVVGLRPTAGRIGGRPPADPRDDLATEGSIGRTVADVMLHDAVLNGDASVPTAPDRPSVAVSLDLGGLPVAAEVRQEVRRVAGALADLGWPVVEDEPDLTGSDQCFETIRAARYWSGYGTLVDDPRIKATVRGELTRGRDLSPAALDDAFTEVAYLRAGWEAFFDDHDVLLCPTSQVQPFPVGLEWVDEIEGVPLPHYTNWMRSCSRVTVSGCPSLSLPGAFADGLPVGIQLVGRRHDDRRLLTIAAAVEEVLGIAGRPPVEALAVLDPAELPPGP